MRTSNDEIINGYVRDGFDYKLQVWVKDYIILAVGDGIEQHPEWRGKDIRQIEGSQ